MEHRQKLSRCAQKIQRSEQILAVAFGKFCQNGFSDTRIEDIAQQLHLSKGTVYLYFHSKEHLFEAMLDHAVQPLRRQLQQYALAPQATQQGLKALLDFLFNCLVENRHNRDLFRLFIAEKARFPSLIAAQHQSLMQAIIALLDGCMLNTQHPTNQPSEGSNPHLSYALLAPIIGALVYQLIAGEQSPFENHQIFSLYLDNLSTGLFIPMSQAP